MSLSRNTAANLVGRVWATAFGIVLIPVYLHFLGVESFALIAIWATLQGMFGLMDSSLSAAFGREIARLSAAPETAQEQRNLLATLNGIYWILALVPACLTWLLAPLIATNWVRADELSAEGLITSIRLIGIIIALQFPIGLYQGGLLALQRQVLYNTISIIVTTVRGVGTIAVLWLISPTIQSFFIWQVVAAALSVSLHWIVLNHVLPRGPRRASFDLSSIAKIWRYAAGSMGNAVGTFFGQQLDKIILSTTLSLEQFGYYAFAGTIATLLWTCVEAVGAAVVPRFNRSIVLGDEEELAREYNRSNQLVATLLVPVAAVLLFFARDIVTVWTSKPDIGIATENLVIVFVLGMSMIGLSNMALRIALCYGWFRLTVAFMLGTGLISAPLYWFASQRWGALGAGFVWMFQGGMYLLVIPLLHRRYIHGATANWAKYTVIFPILAAGAVCGVMRLIAPTDVHPAITLLILAFTWASATVAVALVEPTLRVQILAAWEKLRVSRSASK